MTFEIAATTEGESTSSYDAIFCLAVLVNGDLTTSAAPSAAIPFCHFDAFDRHRLTTSPAA